MIAKRTRVVLRAASRDLPASGRPLAALAGADPALLLKA
jgi:hypothetical protein